MSSIKTKAIKKLGKGKWYIELSNKDLDKVISEIAPKILDSSEDIENVESGIIVNNYEAYKKLFSKEILAK